jgi:peptidoglycan/LPS O-acetylase OafA/YrhL
LFLPVLEILRGIAALLVVLYHVSWNSHLSTSNIVHNGYLMVDLFFILSGYVMLHSYGSRLATFEQAKLFIRARFARLYPLHLATLGGFVAIELLKWITVYSGIARTATTPFSTNNAKTLAVHLLLLQGMGLEPQPTWNTPAWSIGVEFWLYSVFAAAMLLLTPRRIAIAAVILAAAGMAASWNLEHSLNATADHAFLRGLAGFFTGVLIKAANLRLPRQLFVPLLLAVLVFLALKPAGPGPTDFLAIPLFAALIAAATNTTLAAPQPLVWTGKVSYSIYLVHQLVIWCFEFVLQYVLKTPRDGYYAVSPWTGDLLTILLLAILLPVTAVTYAKIEAPWRNSLAGPPK